MVLMIQSNYSDSDDASTVSTRNHSMMACSEISLVSRPQKRVRFGKKYIYSTYLEGDDIPSSDIWYNKEDYDQFRESLKMEARKVAKTNRKEGTDQAVETAFQRIAALHEPAEVATPALEHELSALLQQGSSKLQHTGLERFLSRKIYSDKTARRTLMTKTIMQLQQQSSTRSDSEAIRLACEKLSRPSIAFARCVAKAARSA